MIAGGVRLDDRHSRSSSPLTTTNVLLKTQTVQTAAMKLASHNDSGYKSIQMHISTLAAHIFYGKRPNETK